MTKRIQKSGKATDLITFTRSTTGTYLDSVVYGKEQVSNGEFLTNSSWSIHGADAASYFGNNKAYVESAGANAYIVQQLTGVTAGKVYRLSFNLISEASSETEDGLAYVRFAGVDIAHPIGQRQLGAQSYIFTAGSASQELRFMTYAHDGASFTIDSVSVVEVKGNQGKEGEFLLRTAAIDEPRIDYNADKTVKGLLIEGSRTNRVTNSDFADSRERTTSGDGVFTPLNENKLGVFNGFRVVSGGATWHRVNKYVSVTSGTVYSVSFYYRYGTSGKGRFECRVGSNSSTVTIDESTGTGTVGSTAGGTIEFLSDEAFGDIRKLTCRWTPNATGSAAGVGIATNSAVVGETIIAYAVQVEGGLVASSYIPTTTAMVSRASDVARVPTVDDFTHNKVQGTTIVELDYSNWKNFATFARAYSWKHSGSINILNEIYNNGNAIDTGKIRYRADNGSGSPQTGAANIEGSENYSTGKVAFALKDNDMAVAWNGSLVVHDTLGQPAINLVTALYIGAALREDIGTAGDFAYAHIKSIKYYPVRLTNEQMKALTL